VDQREVVARERQLLQGGHGERLWAYWRDALTGELPELDLPTDYPRPPTPSFRGATHRFTLGTELSCSIRGLAHQAGVTMNATLLAAFSALLSRYSGQEDILVGVPTANRRSSDLKRVVGYLVNPVAVHAELVPDMTFWDLLRQTGDRLSNAVAHAAFPFPVLVERLSRGRDGSRSPIFQAMFVLQGHRTGLQPARITGAWATSRWTPYPLTTASPRSTSTCR
jgi:non-ribosomal peptide synthetase component F